MTVREFTHAHPGEALDILIPEGRVLLEPSKIAGLFGGRAVNAMPGNPRKAAYVQAEELLEQTVCSAYLWRLASSYDPLEREVRQHHPGIMRWRRL